MTENSVLIGRRIVLSVIVFTLLVSAFALLLPLFSRGDLRITSLVRFALTTALCWQLYQGKGWARVVSIVLMTLAGILALLGGLGLMAYGYLGMLLAALGVAYLAAALVLGVARPVRRYFAYLA